MPSRSKINATIVIKSWLQITDELSEDYHDRWICDESWFRIIGSKYPNFTSSFDFKRKHIALFLPEIAGGFNILNKSGVYHKSFKTNCPYNGKRRVVHYFYRHKLGLRPDDISSCPPCAFFSRNNQLRLVLLPF